MRAPSFPSLLLQFIRGRSGASPAPLRTPLLRPTQLRGSLCFAGILSSCFSSTAENFFEYERDQAHVDATKLEKDTALNQILSQLEVAGVFDKPSCLWLPRFFASRYVPVISTGSLKLDIALGIGGLPKGRIVEIYGMEASGKTTLALQIVKEAQKHGGCCAYIDAENALDLSVLDTMGINTRKLLFSRSDCAENTLNVVDTLVKSGGLDVIVVDSVAALVPQYELDNVLSATSEDTQSRIISRAVRKIHYTLSQSETLAVFVNQVRSKLTSSHNNGHVNEVSCGGNALKFYAAMRLRTARAGLLQTDGKTSGINISVEVIKNKLAPAMKRAGIDIRFGKGIRCEAEILELASSQGILSKGDDGYWIGNTYLECQREAERYIAKNSDVKDELVRILRNRLFGRN